METISYEALLAVWEMYESRTNKSFDMCFVPSLPAHQFCLLPLGVVPLAGSHDNWPTLALAPD